MSKGTYSHSNRHRMHENLVPNLGTKMGTKMDAEIEKMFADAKPLTEADLKAFSEKNREIMESPSFKTGVLEDEVANLKGIIEELKRTLSKSMYALQDNERLEQENKKLLDKISLLKTDYLVLESEYFAKLDELERENAELKKDKERLEWLMKELDEVLYGDVALETREDIDEAMNQPTQ